MKKKRDKRKGIDNIPKHPANRIVNNNSPTIKFKDWWKTNFLSDE